ncbi:hypothetical protein HG530_009832 [Fusarium avenaceum]|nr:hypothetical protein HG530_009832 [Fusarium avenaceum]
MPQTSTDAPWNLFGPLLTEYSTIVNLISLVCISCHSHGGHITSGTSTLDNERVASISLGVEADNVITSLKGSNGMRAVKLLQANLDLLRSSVNASNKSDYLTSLLGSSLGLLHLDKALHGERGRRLDRDTGKASQDSQLAGNIETVEVVSGVGLRVTQRLSLLDFLRPLTALALSRRKGVEEEGHGATENTLNLGDLVASLDKVLQGGDDRKTSTNGGLMVDSGA